MVASSKTWGKAGESKEVNVDRDVKKMKREKNNPNGKGEGAGGRKTKHWFFTR